MKDIIRNALDGLRPDKLKNKRVALGFDGCMDTIYKVVKKSRDDSVEFFSTIREFGSYIAEKSEISCSIELYEQSSKAGGNSTIFAAAVSRCGVNTSVIGLFGESRIDEVFNEVNSMCDMYSYQKNALALALEFIDGKIMLYPKIQIEGDVWEHIMASVGEPNIKPVFFDADMFGLVNWGELEYSTYIWRKLYALLSSSPDRKKKIMVDLSDCSRSTEQDLKEMLKLLEEYTEIRTVMLSLNESEAKQLYRLFCDKDSNDYELISSTLAGKIAVDRIILHSRKRCYTCQNGQVWSMPTQFIESPKLLTGAGDNFNAGYALGCLLELPIQTCNALGNAASSYYIQNGISPDIEQLKAHLKQWLISLE